MWGGGERERQIRAHGNFPEKKRQEKKSGREFIPRYGGRKEGRKRRSTSIWRKFPPLFKLFYYRMLGGGEEVAAQSRREEKEKKLMMLNFNFPPPAPSMMHHRGGIFYSRLSWEMKMWEGKGGGKMSAVLRGTERERGGRKSFTHILPFLISWENSWLRYIKHFFGVCV